jgi:14-3-3 protein epsilon
MTDVQNVITQAKLAEQTERYEGRFIFPLKGPGLSEPIYFQNVEMVDFMKTVVDLSKGKLGIEERNLLSVAYKNVVGSKRASYRHLVAMEAKEEPKEKKEVIVEYRQKVEKELSDVCASVIDVLDKYLIPSAEQDESKVFYLKM